MAATASGGRPAAGAWAASGSLRIQVSWRRAKARVRAFMRAAASSRLRSPSRKAQSSRTPMACNAVREMGPRFAGKGHFLRGAGDEHLVDARLEARLQRLAVIVGHERDQTCAG